MSQPSEENRRKKAARGEGTVYWDEAKNTYRAEVSVGFTSTGRRLRLKAYGKTEAKARANLRAKVKEHEAGLDTSTTYTVADAVNDWYRRAAKGKKATLDRKRGIIDNHIIPHLGRIKLKDLSADDVDDWLISLKTSQSTDSLKKMRSILRQAIRHAQRRDKVGRNVAELVDLPEGRQGRPSKAMNAEQVAAVFKASEGTWIHAYLVLSNFTGVRPEEARPLEWKHTHLNPVKDETCSCGIEHPETLPPHVEVWRTTREGEDTKTEKSRRTIALPTRVIRVLQRHRQEQTEWRREHGYKHEGIRYVFGTRNDTVKDAGAVRRMYRSVLKDAGLNPKEWVPRETRHTFVSIMSDSGVSDDVIADLVGHAKTSTTRTVYRHQLRPVITTGAEIIEVAFSDD